VIVPDVPSFAARGFQRGDIPVVSFRGDVRNEVMVSAEDVAGFSRALLKQGKVVNGQWRPRPIVTVIEEVSEASTNGRKYISAPSVRWLAEQGRKVGGSLVGTTQSPRNIPLDLLEQASAIAFFRLTGGGANYLAERLKLNPALIEAVAGPDGEGLPNYQFVLAIKGQPWDRKVHQLDQRTVAMFE
jgi:DNA helicase HerA-like ATPase